MNALLPACTIEDGEPRIFRDPGVRPDLRHSFVSLLSDNGVHIEQTAISWNRPAEMSCALAAEGFPVPGCMFTPFWETPVLFRPALDGAATFTYDAVGQLMADGTYRKILAKWGL